MLEAGLPDEVIKDVIKKERLSRSQYFALRNKIDLLRDQKDHDEKQNDQMES